MVTGNLETEQSRRGNEVRGEYEHSGEGGGRGSGSFVRWESGGDQKT